MEKRSIVNKIWSNIYVKNILLIFGVFILLIILVLFGLKFYTKHSESIAVPLVKDLQVEDAAGILRSADLGYDIIDSLYQSGGTPGAILEQVPKAGSKVKKGRSIYLIVQAKNQQMVEIPLLEDFSQRQAEAQLNALGFNKIVIEEAPSSFRGIVLSISYKGKTLRAGQKVPKGSVLRMIVGAGGEIHNDSISNEEAPEIDKSFFE